MCTKDKRIQICLLFCTISFSIYSNAVQPDVHLAYERFLEFKSFYDSGKVSQAENCMLQVLEHKKFLNDEYLVAAYNNLGAINTLLGRYNESLDYYRKAEELILERSLSSTLLADIYINFARVYNLQELFSYSIDFIEKGLRIYLDLKTPDRNALYNISVAYQNIGISYFGIREYRTALDYFKKSADLKARYNLSKIAFSFLNIAKVYAVTGDKIQAEKFFLKSMLEFNKEFGQDNYRISDIFFDYSTFLQETGQGENALKYLLKSLEICMKELGMKHTYVSTAYMKIGNYYSGISSFNTALSNYQKALIAHTGGFQNGDFHFNPSYDSIAVDVEFLDILHNKARTLERLAYLQDNPGLKKDYLLTGAETVKLATRGIKDLRKTYLSEDSRLYLAENEKETYLTSIRISNELFNLTADTGYINNAYNVVMEAKSSVLKQRIEDHRIFFSLGLSDSLRIKLQKIVKDISVYNHLIYNELNGPDPDQKKLDYWKDELFRLNREKELNEKDIFQMYPNIPEIVQKTEPVTIADIRKKLGKDETLIEYFLSNQYISGKRKLYIFTLTGHSIFLSENELDSIFRYDLEILKKNVYHATLQTTDEREYITALFRMYDKLFKPLEGIINGNRLIIIPDEEIALLPFDSFIKKIPEGNRVYFDGLQYLVREYIFSYGYSSSLVFSKQKSRAFSTSVYAFSPYHEDGAENKAAAGNYLGGTLKEINAIFDHFKGRRFTGIEASEKNFKSVMEDQAIFHLAMHAITDTLNTQYSCLVFNHDSSEAEDGRLFNYEIGLSRIRSPMVVLSACNTGTGELYHGEGVMSLARGFILAGASSVIKTAWDVNDESSARIIMSFYSFLFKGKPKDEALRLAKLEYLKNSPPTYSHPFFWAAYEVMGDNSPVVVRKNYRFIVIFSGILLVVTACSIYFFRRRRIFSARSL